MTTTTCNHSAGTFEVPKSDATYIGERRCRSCNQVVLSQPDDPFDFVPEQGQVYR